MFKSGGYNVYPSEVEQVLCGCPGVTIAAVVDAADPVWGQVGVAFVAIADGDPSIESPSRASSERGWPLQVPKRLEIRSALPQLENGKVDKKALREKRRPSWQHDPPKGGSMKPARFEYFAPRPSKRPQASCRAWRFSEVLAGGQSLVPMMNLRLAGPACSSTSTASKAGIRNGHNAHVSLGATVRQARALSDAKLARMAPLVVAGLRHSVIPRTGHAARRRKPHHHDPAAELPAIAVALDAEIIA